MARKSKPTSKTTRGPRMARSSGKSRALRKPKAPPLMVTFTDARLLEQKIKPPFPDEEGDYEEPGLVIPGGRVPPNLPAQVTCPGALVIYSSWAQVVPNCNGFKGPGAGNNAVVARARANANAVAARIPCKNPCEKTVVEIWHGWDCGGNPQPIVAIAAVEVKIICQITAALRL